MKAIYDNELITLTPGFIAALENLMREEMTMMRAHEAENAEYWAWGQCTISDLATTDGLAFMFGSDDDKPENMTGDVQVLCVLPVLA